MKRECSLVTRPRGFSIFRSYHGVASPCSLCVALLLLINATIAFHLPCDMFGSKWKSFLASSTSWFFGRDVYHNCEVTTKQVEDYRPGYPRFSALFAAHHSFQICRRFSKLRARVLFLKQDKLSMLEQQLEDIDTNERAPLFLGSSRDDHNEDRSATLLEIDRALEDYDNFVERSHRMLSSDAAKPRAVQNLQNWVNGNGCLSWEESEYLNHCNDLRGLVPVEDGATMRFEAWVEDRLVWLLKKTQKTSYPNLSRDPHVFISSTPFIGSVARTLIVLVIIILQLLPIVICRSVGSSSGRVVIIILSLVVFLFILSSFVTRRTNELFLAGATYTTVLVVFVSGTNVNVS